jgi:hypothetical protein
MRYPTAQPASAPQPATAPISRTVMIGRTAQRERVTVTVQLAPPRIGRPATMTDHSERPDTPARLSISGDVTEYRRRREPHAFGQVIDTLADIVAPAGRGTLADVAALADIWQTWHLNDMYAGCIHHAAAASLPDVGQVGTCPDGYRYGSAWLAVEVPGEVLLQLSAILDRLAYGQ